MRSSELMKLLFEAARYRLMASITFGRKKVHYSKKKRFFKEKIYNLGTYAKKGLPAETDLSDLTEIEIGTFYLLTAMIYLKEH